LLSIAWTPAEYDRLRANAAAGGMSVAEYVSQLTLANAPLTPR
jgi:hypothetical protein